MKIDILTLFPEFFNNINDWSILGRAIEEEIVDIKYTNIRDYSKNKHKKVDDYPYGGGPGMVMTPEPIDLAIEDVRSKDSKVIFMSPQGKKMDQKLVNRLSKEKHLVLLCGHYEGIDNRIIENYIDEEVSIGDYVLTGGEIPAMVMIDAVIRLLPGVLSGEESFKDESHYDGLLEYPQYTRPREYKGYSVPDILLSGNHQKIDSWKREKSLENTYLKRPELLKDIDMDKEDIRIIKDIVKKYNKE